MGEDTWYCPSHSCFVCNNNVISSKIDYPSSKKYMCSYCATAYCDKHCPLECKEYKYCDVEFLCSTCLSQRIDGDNVYKFGSERFISRLLELHKRKRDHLNRILGKRKDDKNIIPSHCKLGR